MGKHNSRDNKTGRFAKMDPVTDVVAPDAGTPTDFAYGEVRRYAPAADELAQGGEQDLAGRSPIEIDGQTGESFGRRVSEVPGLPGEIFGGRGVVRHDVAHGGMQRPLAHRRQIVVDAQSGQELDARITSVPSADPFASNLMGRANDGAPPTRTIRRTPGTGGYKVPAMGQSDREADWKGGR